MSSTLIIIDIFANHSPVLKFEGFFAKNVIGLEQAVEYEPVRLAQSEYHQKEESKTTDPRLTGELRPRSLIMSQMKLVCVMTEFVSRTNRCMRDCNKH